MATLAPLAYYGRLLAIGLMAPDRAGEPVDAWRPRLTRPDLGAASRPGSGTTWNANRAFTTVTIAILLAVLALATSSGAFDGPVAAAGLPPSLSGPGELVAPVPSRRPAGPGRVGRAVTSSRAGRLLSRRASTQRSMSRS